QTADVANAGRTELTTVLQAAGVQPTAPALSTSALEKLPPFNGSASIAALIDAYRRNDLPPATLAQLRASPALASYLAYLASTTASPVPATTVTRPVAGDCQPQFDGDPLCDLIARWRQVT